MIQGDLTRWGICHSLNTFLALRIPTVNNVGATTIYIAFLSD